MRVTGILLCGILVSIFLPVRAADLPSFDAASVKRSDPNNRSSASNVCTGGPGTSDPTTLRCTNAGLSLYVLMAYDVKFYEVICPNWVMLGGPNNGYDITAKIQAGTTKEQYRLMLQHLLAGRFHMVVHRESRELPVYALMPGKGRSKLNPSTTPAPPGPRVAVSFENNHYIWKCRNTTLETLAGALTTQLWSPVKDSTGLTGEYDFTLEFVLDPRWQARVGWTPLEQAGDDGPTIFSAVSDQLGLKLDARKGQVSVLVVDAADKVPVQN